MSQCAYCIAPANGEKPTVYSSAPTCDRHCGYSAGGEHMPDANSFEAGEEGTLHVTCHWCGQAGTIRKVDVTWM